jgi:S1-C subfamily serine protease
MKKGSVYSSSHRSRPAAAPAAPREALRKRAVKNIRAFDAKHQRKVHFGASVLFAALAVLAYALISPTAQHLTQKDINDSVKYTLEHQPRAPDPTAVAAAIIRPSVVRVNGYNSKKDDADTKNGKDKDKKAKADIAAKDPNAKPGDKDAAAQEDEPDSVGSGVIIDDKGTILTNLHVAASAEHLKVIFFDGTESDAEVVGAQPEDDLAVLLPKRIPDDMKPATLASTKGLMPGDMVVATGFPFGIGPSVTAGVVSGLKREYMSEGKTKLKNLIQFDAAANPGNSGGPLVNKDGEVLGIVTGILNPTGQRVFAGIGFAVPIENAAAAAGMSPF